MTIADGVFVQGEADAVEYLNDWIAGRQSANVLDAGCGERCALDYGADAVVTGLDVSAALLARNPRLDRRVAGDLATTDLDPASYDTVVCWDVLEHLRDPVAALENLDRSLAERGALILKAPNLRSVKGVATKYTPYRFHRWIYHRFDVSESDPFPTYFDRSIAPSALLGWAAARGLRVRWVAYWESDLQNRLRSRLHVDGAAWRFVARAVRGLSAGSLDATATDFVLVFERSAS